MLLSALCFTTFLIAVKGPPDDIYHLLHHSFADILKMRRSIESADGLIDPSIEAVLESCEPLKRVREAGF